MLYIWGRNNNHLIRNNHKITYSMPQKMPYGKQISKCACGSDYIIFLTHDGTPHVLYQSTIYQLNKMPKLNDVAVQDNLIIGVTKRGAKVIAWEFLIQKVLADQIKPIQVPINSRVMQVYMGFGDIFLQTDEYQVYHFKRNQWYQTKTFSNVLKVKTKNNMKIIEVAAGQKTNLFLSYDGTIFKSKKTDPLQLTQLQCEQKFIKIAASNFYSAINKSGSIYIWGNTINGKFQTPTLLSKLSKKFVSVSLNFENGYALSDDGQVWIWGKNANGQLGVSDYEQRVKPFPLITLDSQNILSIFGGYGYACCIVQPHCRKQSNRRYSQNNINTALTVSNFNKNFNQNINSQNISKVSLSPQKNLKYQIPNVKKSKKSVQIANTTTATIANQSQSVRNQKIRQYYQTQKQNKTNQVRRCRSRTSSLLKSNRSVTPKTPKSNKQNKQCCNRKPLGRKSINNNKEINKTPQIKSTPNYGKILVDSAKFINQQAAQNEKVIIHLKQQNYCLISKVQQKQMIIADLIRKMKILQSAIDEHQRGLSARDNILDQYERRQKQYLMHIDQLQKTLQRVVKDKSAPLSAHQAYKDFNLLYEDLKINFQKQREYYMQKLKEYESCFVQQRHKYQNKIRQLEEEVSSFRDNKVTAQQLQDKLFQRNMIDVNRTIQRIQQNKYRISRSANKLIQMLQMQNQQQ